MPKPEPEAAPAAGVEVDYLGEVAGRLENSLGRRVRIEQGKKSGTLTLEFYGTDDLERLLNALEHLTV